jgi:hypothetical protein
LFPAGSAAPISPAEQGELASTLANLIAGAFMMPTEHAGEEESR